MSAARVEDLVRKPHPSLRRYVGDYVGYDFAGLPPGVHLGLPSGSLTFIVSINERLCLYDESRGVDETYGVLLAGLHLRRTLVRHNGSMAGIQINFSPIAPRAFFGIPAGEVAHRSYDLDVIAQVMADELNERVNAASTWDARFVAIDEVLLSAAREARGPREEVINSWRQIARSHGGLPISLIADQVGWSRRHLNTQFNAEFGIGPKDAARVLRYDRARRMISSGRLKIADIAAICGYADQAHLNRDFKSFTGTSPRTWLFDVSSSATRVRAGAAANIEQLLDGAVPLFPTTVRSSQTVAREARDKGMLVHELAERVEGAKPFWESLRAGERPERLPGSAPALAADYVALIDSILQRIAELEAGTDVA